MQPVKKVHGTSMIKDKNIYIGGTEEEMLSWTLNKLHFPVMNPFMVFFSHGQLRAGMTLSFCWKDFVFSSFLPAMRIPRVSIQSPPRGQYRGGSPRYQSRG